MTELKCVSWLHDTVLRQVWHQGLSQRDGRAPEIKARVMEYRILNVKYISYHAI